MGSLAAGIGAGIVSALLFAVVITGSPLALLLSYLAPLPVFVAALGWRHHAGLVAAVTGAIVLTLALRVHAGLAYFVGISLPAWGIAYLSLLGRADERGQIEWYPLGSLMLWIVGTAALVTLTGAIAIAGDYETYIARMTSTLEAVLSGRLPGLPPPRLPQGLSVQDVASTLASWAPVVAGASFVPMLALNLWLAAKAVHMSGRLPRTWPYLPSMTLPVHALGIFGASVVAAFVIDGFAGFFAKAVLGAMIAAMMLNGLAAIHQFSAGKSWRLGLLAGVYVSLLIASTLFVPALVVLGLADCLFRLRGRMGGPPPPQTI